MQPHPKRLSAFPAKTTFTPRPQPGSGLNTYQSRPLTTTLSKDLPSVPRPQRSHFRNTSRLSLHDDEPTPHSSSRSGPRSSPQSTRTPSTAHPSTRKLRITTPGAPLSASSYTSTSFTPVKSPLRHSSKTPSRPLSALPRQNSSQSRYMDMLLTLNRIPRLHNILALVLNWLLFAGFFLFPASFSDAPIGKANVDIANRRAAPLLTAASTLCCTGLAGLVWLSIRWRAHYVWLVNRLYLPAALHGLAGLFGTVAGVYAQHEGFWSVPARIALAFEATIMVVFAVLFVVCSYMLGKVKGEHVDKLAAENENAPKGLMGLLGRAVTKPPFAPGSIV